MIFEDGSILHSYSSQFFFIDFILIEYILVVTVDSLAQCVESASQVFDKARELLYLLGDVVLLGTFPPLVSCNPPHEWRESLLRWLRMFFTFFMSCHSFLCASLSSTSIAGVCRSY